MKLNNILYNSKILKTSLEYNLKTNFKFEGSLSHFKKDFLKIVYKELFTFINSNYSCTKILLCRDISYHLRFHIIKE